MSTWVRCWFLLTLLLTADQCARALLSSHRGAFRSRAGRIRHNNNQAKDGKDRHRRRCHEVAAGGEINFLQQVETTVSRVLAQYVDCNTTTPTNSSTDKDFVLTLEPDARESFGVARLLQKRLQAFQRNNDCPRCWLQRAHCVCSQCPPLLVDQQQEQQCDSKDAGLPKVRRIFLVMHHKEICLAVDTAKLILACFPRQCRLVVAGIGPEYQASMQEMLQSIATDQNNPSRRNNCLVLFPSEDAKTFQEIEKQQEIMTTSAFSTHKNSSVGDSVNDKPQHPHHDWDIIVIDGTWSQARKLHRRYFPPEQLGGPTRVQLSSQSLVTLQEGKEDAGRQLRRHPIHWRTISTMEATRLLLKDISDTTVPLFDSPMPAAKTSHDQENRNDNNYYDHLWDKMSEYQTLANQAAQCQLGPPRSKNI